MEVGIIFGVATVIYAVMSFVVLLLLGGLMGVEIPGWGGLLWRSAVLGLLGAFGAIMPCVPLNLDMYVLMSMGLIGLCSIDFPDDWFEIVLFCAAMFVGEIALGLLLSILLTQATQATQAT